MNNVCYAFGEVLWDCLPSGRHPGGAPFNVASHVVQLNVAAGLISAVGQDALGKEILEVAAQKNVDTGFVSRARVGLPTGTVLARVDGSGNATYEIVHPVAWDEIQVSAAAVIAVRESRAFVFGSLASRGRYNQEPLNRLLAVAGPTKFFDVNMRPPFADPAQIMVLARSADVLKLNDTEVGQLAMFLRTGEATPNSPASKDEVTAACAVLAEATATPCICVTMGAAGAILWEAGTVTHAPAPSIVVRDTVGAGDAFMAGLIVGLIHGADRRVVLHTACEMGAFVASQPGATPPLPAAKAGEWMAALQSKKGELLPRLP